MQGLLRAKFNAETASLTPLPEQTKLVLAGFPVVFQICLRYITTLSALLVNSIIEAIHSQLSKLPRLDSRKSAGKSWLRTARSNQEGIIEEMRNYANAQNTTQLDSKHYLPIPNSSLVVRGF